MKIIKTKLHFWCLVVILSTFNFSFGVRLVERMYDELQSDHYCYRRLNATHQFGCTSEPGGNVGTLWMINDDQDFDHILKNGPTPPYIAISSEEYFTTEHLLKIKNSSGRVGGLIVMKLNNSISAFSPDSTRPNQYFGLYVNDTNKPIWQETSAGNEMLFQDFPFPIFLITEKRSIEALDKCAKHNNPEGKGQAGWPLCGAQLDSFMMAAKNSISCLLDRATVDNMFQASEPRCSYPNSPNLFSYYKPEISTTDESNPLVGNRSVVFVTARLDSISMFRDFNPGADSPTTAIVSLLAIAQSLVKVRTSEAVQSKDRNIAFALFNAESLDYSSSGKTVIDLLNEVYPRYPIQDAKSGTERWKNMRLKSIDYLVELTQLAAYPQNKNIYIHTDPTNVKISDKKINSAKVVFQDEAGIFYWANETMPLPPASAQMFLKHDQEIASLVVSNHDTKFTNPYYNSIFDNSDNLLQVGLSEQAYHLANVSTTIARAIFQLAFGQVDESIQANATFIQELLSCYLIDANCSFFNEVYPASASSQLPNTGLNSFNDNIQRKMTLMSLAYILGEKMRTLNSTQCRDDAIKHSAYSYRYIRGDTRKGLCLRSQTFETTSISPAWYYLRNETIMRDYSAWTLSESNIRVPVRIFYQSSPLLDWMTFGAGLSTMLASFALIHVCFNKFTSVVEM